MACSLPNVALYDKLTPTTRRFAHRSLGPTYGAKKCLDAMNLDMKDIGVFEIHEAFAGQVLSNLTAMNSDKFAEEKGWGKKIGEIDQSKMNTKGGSLR